MTGEQVSALLAILATGWPDRFDPRKGIDLRATARAYHLAWGDLPYEETEAAVAEWLRHGRFFPVAAEIRALVIERELGIGDWEGAWAEVRRQVAAFGRYGRPCWSNRVLADTVGCFGWGELCGCEGDRLETLRAQFRDAYRAFRERFQRSDDVRPALEEAAQHRMGPGGRGRASALPPPSPALPPADPGWEAAYRTTGEETPSTRRARERWERARESRRARGTPPEGFTVLEGGAPGVLGHLPAWRALPEERRAELLDAAGYGGGGAEVAPPPEDATPAEPGSVGGGEEGDDGGAP